MPPPIVHHKQSITISTFLGLLSHKKTVQRCIKSLESTAAVGWAKTAWGRMRERQHLHVPLFFILFNATDNFFFLCFNDLENMSSKVSESTHSTGSCAFSNQCLGASWGELTFAADKTICRSNVVCHLGNRTVGKGAGA